MFISIPRCVFVVLETLHSMGTDTLRNCKLQSQNPYNTYRFLIILDSFSRKTLDIIKSIMLINVSRCVFTVLETLKFNTGMSTWSNGKCSHGTLIQHIAPQSFWSHFHEQSLRISNTIMFIKSCDAFPRCWKH